MFRASIQQNIHLMLLLSYLYYLFYCHPPTDIEEIYVFFTFILPTGFFFIIFQAFSTLF